MSALSSPGEIKTLLIDDEAMAIHRLQKALESYPQVKIIGEVKDGRAAIESINRLRPDLVFLDIQMPEFSGLEVLSHLDYSPMIVFVTAYEEYAVKAFEKNSLDYLLKPVEQDRLEITMQRIMERRAGEGDVLSKIKALLRDQQTQERISTIPVKTGSKITLVQVADIYFMEAKDKYVYLHTHAEEKLVEYPLTYLQDRLPPEFVRVHRSFIINKLKVKEIHKYFKGTYLLLMNDSKGSEIKSAYAYGDAIRNKLLLP